MSVDLGYAIWIPAVIFIVWMVVISTRLERVRGRWLTRKEKSRQLTKMAVLATLSLISGGLPIVFSREQSLSSGNAIVATLCCVLGPIGGVLLVMIPFRLMILGTPSARKQKNDETPRKMRRSIGE
jgi:hypothetical protein